MKRLSFLVLLGALALTPALAQDADPDVDSLIEQLGAADFQAREAATEKLIALGPKAVPALEKALLSDDPEVNWRAQQALDSIRNAPSPDQPDQRQEGFPPGMRVVPLVPGEGFEDLEKLLQEGLGEQFGKLFEDMLDQGDRQTFSFQLGNGNSRTKGNFGDVVVSTVPVGELLRHQLGLEDGVGVGLSNDCENIERFGLQPWDVLLEVDGQPVSKFGELGALFKLPAGVDAQLRILRGGEILDLQVTVQDTPKKENNTRERDF